MEFSELTCVCGRYFDRPAALSKHKRTCRRTKFQLDVALSKAKDLWAQKMLKRQTTSINYEASDSPSDQVTGVNAPTERNHDVDPATAAIAPGPVLDLTSNLSTVSQRPQRQNKRQPGRFKDMIPIDDALALMCIDKDPTPEPTTPARETHTPTDSRTEPDESTRISGEVQPILCSRKDKFGVFRMYYSAMEASRDPDRGLTLKDILDLEECFFNDSEPTDEDVPSNFGPYPNRSSFLLSEWYWAGGKQKSRRDFQELIRIISDPEFKPNDIRKTPWPRIDGLLGSSEYESDRDAGWVEEEIEILVPFHRFQSEFGPQTYQVGTFVRRNIISIIRETLSGSDGEHFHFEPFNVFWQPPLINDCENPPLRVYGELYNSQAFTEEYCRLQQSPPVQGCSLPRSIVAIMFSSDETHLTQYGENHLWPLYMYFGNVSKYHRRKPNSSHCHHVAYFISLPDEFDDYVRSRTGKGPTDSLKAFCNRELLHAQWKNILDDDFLDAYAHGFVFDCLDGVVRRLYPRIFTLTADYKEKTNLTGIRHLGIHPCPRCFVKLADVHQMGTEEDRLCREKNPRQDNDTYRAAIGAARKQIFEERYAVKGAVDTHLDPFSLAPNENAFSTRLSAFGFDVFRASVVDIMHDFEQGTWKSVFIHLIRILACEDKKQVSELDFRYRQVPPFGRDTIRVFRNNISDMKGLAARDYEDMLQCSIPAFEGLLPEAHSIRITKLLFIFAQWHGLAKLRLHTDATLQLLDRMTTELGNIAREFQAQTCREYATKELEKEKAAREKRKEKAEKAKQQSGGPAGAAPDNQSGPRQGNDDNNDHPPEDRQNKEGRSHLGLNPENLEKDKEFTLKTYKFHALGDYVENIRFYGTTDSYSTEAGESEHRRSKARYSRTNKKEFIKQIAQTERREARIRRIRDENLPYLSEEHLSNLRQDLLEDESAVERYHMSRTPSKTENILDILRNHPGDPAMKNFLHQLKVHLFPRACEIFKLGLRPYERDSAPASIFFQHDRIYEHKILRLNYTTYDLRRDQDFVNPRTSQSNIMLLATRPTPPASPTSSRITTLNTDNTTEVAHPFLYAKVLRIFHVNVICTEEHISPDPVRMDVLWVRWYQHHAPSSSYHLDELSFVPMNNEDAFGFVDPRDAIRCCHVVPAFAKGRKYEANDTGLSSFAKDRDDWKAYYVNRFVDRDMLMRYHLGLGIGHIMLCLDAEEPIVRGSGHPSRNNPPQELGRTTESEEPSRVFGVVPHLHEKNVLK